MRNDSGLKHGLGCLLAIAYWLLAIGYCAPALAGAWYVGNTAPGEWIEYQQVWLTNGHYRFTARAAAVTNAAALHLEIDGARVQSGVAVPYTGRPDSFVNVHLGSTTVSQGYHNLRVVFESPGVSLDWFMLRKDSDTTNGVKDSDVAMVRPATEGMLVAPVVGFEHHESMAFPANSAVQLGVPDLKDDNGRAYSEYQLTNWYGVPMYRDFDRRSDRYWDIMVEQLLATRAQVPLIHCRETADFSHELQDRAYSPGGGWYEGRWLQKFSEAVARNSQAASALKIGMFWESGGVATGYSNRFGFYPGWSTTNFVDYVMQYWLEPWFDHVPRELLYQPMPSRPVISFWASTPDSIVKDGKMGDFLRGVRVQMQARYGLEPLFVLPVRGCVDTPALAQAWGQASWVTWDGPLFTSNYFAGAYWGTSSSGSRRRIDTVWMNDWDPLSNTGTPAGTESPGHDSHQPRLDAQGNSMMWNALNQASALGTRFVQEEGFYNIAEGNSIFRSCHPEWKYPNQHMAAMRDFADPATESLLFEAEGCDSYYKATTNDNTGGTYRREWYRPTTLAVYRPLHNAQPWVQMNPGAAPFVQMDAGFLDVWALDNNGQVWAQSITGDANAWRQVSTPQRFSWVSLSKLHAYAWGLAGTTVYSASLPYASGAWTTSGWTQRSGSMVQLSAGATEAWALDASGQVFRRPVDGSGDWTQVNGTMDSIAVGDAFVWGIRGGHIYYSLTSLSNPSWTECPNPYNLIQLQVGSDEVWGVDASGNVYRKSASGAGDWDLMEGNLRQLCVGDGYVWGLSGSTPCYRKLEGFVQPGLAMTPFAPRATSTNGQVLLSWTASGGAMTYNLKRATVSGGPYALIGNLAAPGFTDSNVVNGVTYYYVVSAVNSSGESANSAEIRALPQAAPAAPGNLTATAVSATRIDLTWTNNSGNYSGVKIERKTGVGGPYAEIARTPGPNVTSFSDTEAGFSTQYYYRVRAYNAGGDSVYSAEVSATTPASPGGNGSGTITREVWTGISGSAVSAIPTGTTPNLTYTLTSLEGPTNWGDSYGARIRGYITAPSSGNYTFWIASDDNSQLWLSTDTQPANKVKIAEVTGWTSARAWTWFSSQKSAPVFLNGGLRYYVEVLHKENSGGDNLAVGWARPGEDTSAPSEVVPGAQLSPYSTVPVPLPAAPSSLAAVAISGIQINLSWADNATNEDRLKIERKAGASGAYSQVGEAAPGVTQYSDTDLLPTTDCYYYRVRASNAGGDSPYSNEVGVSPLPGVPTGPDSLVATTVSPSQINLAWADNALNETGFKIERRTTAGGAYSQIATVSAGITNYSDSGLPASSTWYFYRVRVSNAAGDSLFSNEARASTLPDTEAPPAPGVLAAIAGNSQVALVWSAFSGAATYNVKRGTASGGPYTTIQSGLVANNYTDVQVTNGTRYYYVVSGVAAGNEGTNSVEASALPAVPPVFTNNVAGNWNAVAWLPNPPGQPTGGTQTELIFANTAPINSTNDLGGFTLNQLLFAGQAVDLAGSPLALDGAAPLVSSTQDFAFNVANPLTLNQATAFGVSSNTLTLSGAVAGTGGLSKAGAGTLVLSATNSYSGGTTINNGTLQLGDGVRNGVVAGGIVNNSPAVGGLRFNNGAAQTNSMAISGSGSIVKAGNGTLTWGLQSSYTGPTVINGGTITHASGVNGLGANWSPVSINSNATWAFNGVSTKVGTLSLTNGNCGLNKNGNLNVSNIVSSGTSTIGISELRTGEGTSGMSYTSLFNVVDGTLTLAINRLYGPNSSLGSVVKSGSGTMVFANNCASGTPVNNYAWNGATILNGGTFQVMQLASGGLISQLGCSSSNAANLVLNGGALRYTGAAVSIDRLFSLGVNGGTLEASGSGAVSLTNGGAVGFVDSGVHTLTLTGTSAAANILAAALGDNGGATVLLKSGAGAWTLTGLHSFSGGTIVSGGTLTVSSTATLGAGNLSVSNGATCVIQNAGALSTGAYVYLNGTGTLNLAYSGTNTVGRLYIGGVLQPAGVWSAARDGHFAGAGSLYVSTGSASGPIVLNAAALSGGGLRLSWTNSAVDLYYAPSLTPPVVWALVSNQAVYFNGQWSLTLPTGTNGNGFYRLRQ